MITTVAKYLEEHGQAGANLPMVCACAACTDTIVVHAERAVNSETGYVYCDSCAEEFD